MKKDMGILLVLGTSLLTVHAQIGYRVERGLNAFKTWDTAGGLESEVRQTLTEGTNLVQQEFYCIPTDTSTQSLYVHRYERIGNGTFWEVDGSSLIWLADGTVQSNYWVPSYPESGTFSSGGSQGIQVFTSGGKRHQMINFAVFNVYWRTNGDFQSGCSLGNDRASVIFWYRTNSVASGLPWFIAASAVVVPGERRLLSVPTPLGTIWYHMGIDKCLDCGTDCWLSSWPAPALARASPQIKPTPSGYHLQFVGAPGFSYALQRSLDLTDWNTVASGVLPPDGVLQYEETEPLPDHGYYRMMLPELLDFSLPPNGSGEPQPRR